jgi:hypothetical protein
MSTSMRRVRLGSRVRTCWSTPARAAVSGCLAGAFLAASVFALAQTPAAGAAARAQPAVASGTIISVTTVPQDNGFIQTRSSSTYEFVSKQRVLFVGARTTTVVISGSIDLGSKAIRTPVSGDLSVCGQRMSGGPVAHAGRVFPELVTSRVNEFDDEGISGKLNGLSAGRYRFGLCMEHWTASTLFGDSAGTVMEIAG